MPTLHLLPAPLAENQPLSPSLSDVLDHVQLIISERARTTRRWLTNYINVQKFQYLEYQKNISSSRLNYILSEIRQFEHAAFFSEAGLPCVADAGAALVAKCHQNNISIKIYGGESSLMNALSGSGLNGNQFTFHGYLPSKSAPLTVKMQMLERQIYKTNYTQIFIEVPYRNNFLMDHLLEHLQENLILCLVREMLTPEALIISQSIKTWKDMTSLPELHKKRVVYCLGRWEEA